LSGPIDIDKMDYLFRDSLHAGVPYGRHFDQNRLISSLCLNEAGDGLAISDKGKTAAELMVFARYVMFNEVYWHHSVRAATAMLQRAFSILFHKLDVERCFTSTEQEMIELLLKACCGTSAEPLINGLFGPKRKLYKRVAQFSIMENPECYKRLAGKPYDWLCEESLKMLGSLKIEKNSGKPDVDPTGLLENEALKESLILIDAPPVTREVELKISVHYPKEDVYRPLETVSPVVRALAKEQFDDFVKRVRIFAPAELKVEI
ncbi:MAG: HD domain-containing protein, partial [Thermoguttaceae bacterium]